MATKPDSELIPLPRSFYEGDTLAVARELLGKTLVRKIGSNLLSGTITETEAYIGEDDPACHASRGLTPRTRPMYGEAGVAYVYFIYGMYFCLNAVTERPGFPAAVLIRAIVPREGLSEMMVNRQKSTSKNLVNGPGKLCQALRIDKSLNEHSLLSPPLSICEGISFPESAVAKTSRIGIKVGTEKLWRFVVDPKT